MAAKRNTASAHINRSNRKAVADRRRAFAIGRWRA